MIISTICGDDRPALVARRKELADIRELFMWYAHGIEGENTPAARPVATVTPAPAPVPPVATVTPARVHPLTSAIRSFHTTPTMVTYGGPEIRKNSELDAAAESAGEGENAAIQDPRIVTPEIQAESNAQATAANWVTPTRCQECGQETSNRTQVGHKLMCRECAFGGRPGIDKPADILVISLTQADMAAAPSEINPPASRPEFRPVTVDTTPVKKFSR